MFEGFVLESVDVGDVVLRVRHGGSGAPILLLHGHPRTHTTWHRVAALLAGRHTVVCPDLRGYGRSSVPAELPGHASYAKRAMANDCFRLMQQLGHRCFAVVGHDRGSYVAFRLAMDYPDVATHLVVMDGVPIGEALRRVDASFAKAWWHWFFLGNASAGAERVINADPDAWYHSAEVREQMGEESWLDFRAAIHDPATVHAMCEDYRAGLTVDRGHDDADRAAGNRVACPTLVLWSSRDDMRDLYGDPLEVWEPWTRTVEAGTIDSGHHAAEEAPQAVADAILHFLSDG